VYRAGSEGGAAGGAGATGRSGGAVTQPATSRAIAAATTVDESFRAARGGQGRSGAMGWILLEALVALLLAIGIVWWTMGPKRKRRPPDGAGGGDHRDDGSAR
jgi:hypothetical protein